MILENRLPLDDWLESSLPVDEISARLLSIRGLGPWTINYALMRGLGWLDMDLFMAMWLSAKVYRHC